MPISLKTPDEQDHMRAAGRLAAEVLDIFDFDGYAISPGTPLMKDLFLD